jgi:hypothetical protein
LIFPRRPRTIRVCLILLVLWSAVSSPLSAQSSVSKEYQIKAVFLFNFAQFVKWPDRVFTRSDEPFRIGILGDDPFDGFIDATVQGEKVDGHPLVIQRYASVADIKVCQILFISRSESEKMEGILSDLKGKNILTVADSEGFIKSGGIVLLSKEENKIRLQINLEAAKNANLSISSKILRLAEIVGPGKD